MKKETLYIIGAGVLGLAVGYYLTRPKQTEETSSFASASKTDCITREQLACLSSDDTKRRMYEILAKCGMTDSQISAYFKATKKMILNNLCK